MFTIDECGLRKHKSVDAFKSPMKNWTRTEKFEWKKRVEFFFLSDYLSLDLSVSKILKFDGTGRILTNFISTVIRLIKNTSNLI